MQIAKKNKKQKTKKHEHPKKASEKALSQSINYGNENTSLDYAIV